jgi:hypothetical protein
MRQGFGRILDPPKGHFTGLCSFGQGINGTENLGQPYHILHSKDSAMLNFVEVAQVRYNEEEARILGKAGRVLEFVSARVNQAEGVFTL